jgi:hypothetical protein
MTSPSGNVRPTYQYLEDELRRLKEEVAALRSRPLRYAGAFSTQTPDGTKTFETGPMMYAPMPDGTPQWMTTMHDVNGNMRMALWDPDTVAQGFTQTWWEWDHLGNVLRTTDLNGGWAEPHLHFCMHAQFAMPAGTFAYMFTPTNGAETLYWEGRISYLSHPRIGVSGVWGTALGGPNTTRYRLKVSGVTIGAWDVTGIEATTRTFATTPTPANIGAQTLTVQLTAQTLSGTGSFACQVYGSAMKQT